MDGNPTGWDRLKHVDARIWDGLLAAVLLGQAQLDLWYARDTGAAARQPDLLAAALLTLACVPLLWRRRRPLISLVVVSGAVIAFGALQHPSTEVILPLMVASALTPAERWW